MSNFFSSSMLVHSVGADCGVPGATPPRAVVERDRLRTARARPELRGVDAELAEDARERITHAGDHRDLGQVALAAIARQPERPIGDRGVGARGDLGDGELAAPLARGDHDRNVGAGRDALETEVALRVRPRARVRAAGERVVAARARDPDRQGAGLRHRRVDRDVVQRQRAVGRIHLAGDRGRARRRRIDGAAIAASGAAVSGRDRPGPARCEEGGDCEDADARLHVHLHAGNISSAVAGDRDVSGVRSLPAEDQ